MAMFGKAMAAIVLVLLSTGSVLLLAGCCEAETAAYPPTNPTDFTAVPGPTYVALTWGPPEYEGSTPLTGYAIYVSTVTEWDGYYPVPEHPYAVVEPSVRNLTIDGLRPLQKYYFIIKAVSDSGESSVWMTWAIPGRGVPEPTYVYAAEVGDGTVSLSFNDNDPGGSPIIGYRIYRGLAPDNLSLCAEIGWVQVYTDSGLVNGVWYHYEVTAYNSVGESQPLCVVDACPMISPRDLTVEPPWVHTGETVTIWLNWTYPSADLSQISCFRVYGFGLTHPLEVSKENRSAIVHGSGGWGYHFRVSAVYLTGQESFSNWVTVMAPIYEGGGGAWDPFYLLFIAFAVPASLILAVVIARAGRKTT